MTRFKSSPQSAKYRSMSSFLASSGFDQSIPQSLSHVSGCRTAAYARILLSPFLWHMRARPSSNMKQLPLPGLALINFQSPKLDCCNTRIEWLLLSKEAPHSRPCTICANDDVKAFFNATHEVKVIFRRCRGRLLYRTKLLVPSHSPRLE